MESAEKVRLVRCPNCQNVLPELPDYSLYQCGGCGAVLHAKGEVQEDRYLPERCDDDDDESVGAVGESAEGRIAALHDVQPGVCSLNSDQRSSEKSIGYTEPSVGETKNRSGKGVEAVVQNVNTSGISLNGEDGGFRFQAGCENGLRKMESVAGNIVGSLKDGCGGSRGVRYTMSRYPDEGPSDCSFAAMYDNSEALHPEKRDVFDGGSRVHLLERDRAELLRKLDELKIQLSTTREGIPVNGSTVCQDTFGSSNAHSPIISSMSRKQFDAYRHSAGLLHTNRQDPVHNSDRPMQATFNYPGICDHHVMQMHRSCPGPYERVLPHGLISGQYLDPSCDPFGPVPTASIPHQSSCACFSCVNGHREASALVPRSAFTRKHPNVSPSKSLHYLDHVSGVGSSYIDPSYAVPPFISHLRRTHLRQPGQLNSEGFMHRRAGRAMAFDGGRRSRPIAGGAPFLTCSCCFELLQLPWKVLMKVKKRGKIRCGACSAVISYDLKNKKLVFSSLTEVKKATAEDEDNSCEVIKGRYVQAQGYITGASNGFSSDDNDNSGHEGLSSERKRVSSTGCNNLSRTNSLEMESASPGVSDQGNSPIGLNTSVKTVQRSVKRSALRPGSPLQEHFDHTSRDHSANRFGKGNISSRSDHEKVLPCKTVLRQNSSQEPTLATEMEMPIDESSDAVSGESGDAKGDRDRPKGSKGESFLSNIFKKSVKDISRSGQGEEHEKGKGNVYVNGHLIPDRLVKKAEKLAGPIQAGKYWYDFRAGFWGVMGGPCLGIIPPYIQEFNYPMKEKCAGGDTGVSVNGRELHQKDLDLLASRGLPIDRDRSYMIEISGRVYDEDSGEELDCLGKLAPTVEKAKHGFGMRAPKPADT